MALPRSDITTKVSTNAAEHFTQTFYSALESSRDTISSFYVPSATMPDGKPLPAIVFNGNVFPDALAFQTMFKQVPPVHYEVQSYDCHVLNPNFVAANANGNAASTGNAMTILVTVSGYAKFGEPRDAAMRGFSETFLLVPNLEAPLKGRGKPSKEFLIQSQNFRLVV